MQKTDLTFVTFVRLKSGQNYSNFSAKNVHLARNVFAGLVVVHPVAVGAPYTMHHGAVGAPYTMHHGAVGAPYTMHHGAVGILLMYCHTPHSASQHRLVHKLCCNCTKS